MSFYADLMLDDLHGETSSDEGSVNEADSGDSVDTSAEAKEHIEGHEELRNEREGSKSFDEESHIKEKSTTHLCESPLESPRTYVDSRGDGSSLENEGAKNSDQTLNGRQETTCVVCEKSIESERNDITSESSGGPYEFHEKEKLADTYDTNEPSREPEPESLESTPCISNSVDESVPSLKLGLSLDLQNGLDHDIYERQFERETPCNLHKQLEHTSMDSKYTVDQSSEEASDVCSKLSGEPDISHNTPESDSVNQTPRFHPQVDSLVDERILMRSPRGRLSAENQSSQSSLLVHDYSRTSFESKSSLGDIVGDFFGEQRRLADEVTELRGCLCDLVAEVRFWRSLHTEQLSRQDVRLPKGFNDVQLQDTRGNGFELQDSPVNKQTSFCFPKELEDARSDSVKSFCMGDNPFAKDDEHDCAPAHFSIDTTSNDDISNDDDVGSECHACGDLREVDAVAAIDIDDDIDDVGELLKCDHEESCAEPEDFKMSSSRKNDSFCFLTSLPRDISGMQSLEERSSMDVSLRCTDITALYFRGLRDLGSKKAMVKDNLDASSKTKGPNALQRLLKLWVDAISWYRHPQQVLSIAVDETSNAQCEKSDLLYNEMLLGVEASSDDAIHHPIHPLTTSNSRRTMATPSPEKTCWQKADTNPFDSIEPENVPCDARSASEDHPDVSNCCSSDSPSNEYNPFEGEVNEAIATVEATNPFVEASVTDTKAYNPFDSEDEEDEEHPIIEVPPTCHEARNRPAEDVAPECTKRKSIESDPFGELVIQTCNSGSSKEEHHGTDSFHEWIEKKKSGASSFNACNQSDSEDESDVSSQASTDLDHTHEVTSPKRRDSNPFAVDIENETNPFGTSDSEAKRYAGDSSVALDLNPFALDV